MNRDHNLEHPHVSTTARGEFANGSPDLWVQGLLHDNRVKQRRAWLLRGWVTAERYCSCEHPACPAIGGGSELSVREGFLVLTSSGKIRHFRNSINSSYIQDCSQTTQATITLKRG
ncbi:hypothetical protein J6590_002687 [Homalodisca vitripennis]|nr:hypothetical protein J6590_002687 [Homalodisca vitripennis]